MPGVFPASSAVMGLNRPCCLSHSDYSQLSKHTPVCTPLLTQDSLREGSPSPLLPTTSSPLFSLLL